LYLLCRVFDKENPDCLRLFIQTALLLIPAAALVQSQIGAHVFVVGEDGKVETRPVEVDRAFDNQWVISKGLKKGERIVVDGVQKVRSGVVVKAPQAKARPAESKS
jgi:membrane fusion protein (multidrug efflux system)